MARAMELMRVASGAVQQWPLRVAAARLMRQWKLLALVIAVAVIASTAVTSVGLLVTATELSAVKRSLQAIPSSQTAMSVTAIAARLDTAQVTARFDKAIRQVLGSGTSASHTVRAYSAITPAGTVDRTATDAYFGQLDGVRSRVRLEHGSLPSSTTAADATQVDAAIPDSAASGLRLGIGSAFVVMVDSRPVTVHVTGVYQIVDPRAQFWSEDELQGSGFDPSYIPEEVGATTAQDAFGPLLIAPGGLDRIGALADRLRVDYSPTFRSVTPDDLAPLINRLESADSDVAADTGGVVFG